jgi:hypothetical protein
MLDVPNVQPFLETWHFTTSERRRLSRLLVRLRSLQSLPAVQELHELKTASTLLRELDERVHSIALEREF